MRLTDVLQNLHRLRVTPNVLTEASNLIGQHRDPQRPHYLAELKGIIESSCEIVVKSVQAARNPSYERLGLTDSALIEGVSAQDPLITAELRLYLAIIKDQQGAAYNFRTMNPEYWAGGPVRS